MTQTITDVPSNVRFLERKGHLNTILAKRPYAPRMSNSTAWRSYNACHFTLQQFLQVTPDALRAHVLFTTKCRSKIRTKPATKALSRVVEKVLRPHCDAYVWVYHRNAGGYIHWHVVARLKKPFLAESAPTPSERLAWRGIDFHNWNRELRRKGYINSDARALEKLLSAACKSARIGFKVAIEPVDDPDAFARYLARYLRGTAETGRRYYADKGARLWGASRSVKAASCQQYILTPDGRRQRAKLAAYAASKGYNSMEEIRREMGPKWAYWAREDLRRIRLRSYLCEEDYWFDCGTHWSPEALGIRILDPAYSHFTRRFSYREEQVPPSDRERINRVLRSFLSLPTKDWFAPTDQHLSNHITITNPQTAHYSDQQSTICGHRDWADFQSNWTEGHCAASTFQPTQISEITSL